MITARQAADTFLSPQEIATLTGVRIGKDGKTREQLQVASLRKMKIPHYVNAADRPIVARAVIEGGRAPEKVADDVADLRGEQAASDLLGHDDVRTTRRHYLTRGKRVGPTR